MIVTIEELRSFAEDGWPGARHNPLGAVGLSVDEEGCGYSYCDETPADSVVFAYTGGDSVHFCALTKLSSSSGEWPVVMVVPVCRDQPRLVVGATLHEFLSLGVISGYWPLEQLAYDRARAVNYLFDRQRFLDWCYPSIDAQQECASSIAEAQATLGRLAARFGLAPWSTPAQRLEELQAVYDSRVRTEPI